MISIIPTNSENKLRPLLYKIIIFIYLIIFSGCANLQNTSPPKTESQKPEELIKSLPPLLSGGKKPLVIEELADRVNFPKKQKEKKPLVLTQKQVKQPALC